MKKVANVICQRAAASFFMRGKHSRVGRERQCEHRVLRVRGSGLIGKQKLNIMCTRDVAFPRVSRIAHVEAKSRAPDCRLCLRNTGSESSYRKKKCVAIQ